MSLEDLRRRLEDMRRGRAGAPTSLESILYRWTRCNRSHIYIPDPLMDLPELKEVKIFLELDKTNELPFETDKWDCDNYSALLRVKAMLYSHSKGENWAFGDAESNKYGGHRFNLFVAKGWQVYYVEPQDDTLFTKPGKFKFILL